MPRQISKVLEQLKQAYPALSFKQGDAFVWSSSNNIVTYINNNSNEAIWALIHETAHGALGHKEYKSDHALLSMETQAWNKARQIAKILSITIDENHIEDCLDTYRDWLHQRSKCPQCGVTSLQQNNRTYKCFNCHTSWRVPDSPLCKVVRQKIN